MKLTLVDDIRAGILLLSLLTIHVPVLESSSPRNVVLTHVLFRHGDRNPVYNYPASPNLEYWQSRGLSQLTNIGKRQLHELGKFIRERYGDFLNSSYDVSEVLANSTDLDRTLVSSYCLLAGLFPPSGEQVWDEDIHWQPIPVHTKPFHTDYFISDGPFCPRYAEELRHILDSPRIKAIDKENEDLFKTINENSGLRVTRFNELKNIWDPTFLEKLHNVTVPSWINPVYDRIDALNDLRFSVSFSTPKSRRLRGGPLLGHMVRNMKARISGADRNRKLYLLASHDFSISAFLMSLDVFNYRIPPLACAVFVDLLETSTGEFAVEIHYRNDSAVDPHPLVVPHCTSPCPIDRFLSLTAATISDDILRECGANVVSNLGGNLSYAVAILLVCETLLMAACVVSCVVCWHKQRNMQYKYAMVLND